MMVKYAAKKPNVFWKSEKEKSFSFPLHNFKKNILRFQIFSEIKNKREGPQSTKCPFTAKAQSVLAIWCNPIAINCGVNDVFVFLLVFSEIRK